MSVQVSEAWKEAHKQHLLPETFIEISYSVTEPGLQQESIASANMEEVYSDTASISATFTVDREKYSSLEWNFWGLDGSFSYADSQPKNPGYVSNTLSGENGQFTALPTIQIAVPRENTELIPGVTITWSETFSEWASRFRIAAYKDDLLVAERLITNNRSPVSKIWIDLEGYNKFIVEVLEWSHPLHRARVTRVYLGIQTIYTKNDLLGYSHSQFVDPLSAALPKNEVIFRLSNENSRCNPENPSGAERYLMERQEISVKYGMTVNGATEWIDGGHFWISGWSIPANGIEASFTARDSIELMGEQYTGPSSGTLYNIATAAFQQANLPMAYSGIARYYVDSSLGQYSTTIEGANTIAEVLQKVAHMACCVLYQDRNGTMRIEPRNTTPTDYEISHDVSYSYPEFEISKPLKAVEVSCGGEESCVFPVSTAGEVQTVENDFIQSHTDAQRVAEATAELLKERKTLSGEFRADPRLDALDIIAVQSKFATNSVVISEIEYSTTGGGFHGKFRGRLVQNG